MPSFAAAAPRDHGPLELLSNNPTSSPPPRGRRQRAGCASLAHAPSAFNLSYLTAGSNSGRPRAAAAPIAAELPEPVHAIEPAPVAAAPALLRVASYLVPILALPPARGVHWLRLHLYVDREAARERVVLTLARPRDVVPLVHVHAETLAGRFPRALADDPWRVAVERIAARGAGVALFPPRRAASPPPAMRRRTSPQPDLASPRRHRRSQAGC
jgi:hypothetical protein